jgi:hypothetical protein
MERLIPATHGWQTPDTVQQRRGRARCCSVVVALPRRDAIPTQNVPAIGVYPENGEDLPYQLSDRGW